jgi:hypothetical protein
MWMSAITAVNAVTTSMRKIELVVVDFLFLLGKKLVVESILIESGLWSPSFAVNDYIVTIIQKCRTKSRGAR